VRQNCDENFGGLYRKFVAGFILCIDNFSCLYRKLSAGFLLYVEITMTTFVVCIANSSHDFYCASQLRRQLSWFI
jgi:hypothetical protein